MSDELDELGNRQRLSQINTLWSVVRRAHGSQSTAARAAKQQLIERYGAAIQRYLTGALRDELTANDVYQNFVIQFLEGRLASADEQRGKFRNFLKTALDRGVAEHHRKRGRDRLVQAAEDGFEVATDVQHNHEFDHTWRSALLARTWDALGRAEGETGRPLFSILSARVAQPEVSSTDLARELSKSLGRTVTSTHLRVWLHRARTRFAELLVEEVRQSLDASDRETVEQELSELELLEYCRPALNRCALE